MKEVTTSFAILGPDGTPRMTFNDVNLCRARAMIIGAKIARIVTTVETFPIEAPALSVVRGAKGLRVGGRR